MKKDIHPDNYRPVIFLDTSSGEKFLIKSTVETDETGEYEGEEYPLARVEMSSASHPFYTGVERVVDTAGRVEKFKARMEAAQKNKKDTKKKKTKQNTSPKEGDSEPQSLEDLKEKAEN